LVEGNVDDDALADGGDAGLGQALGVSKGQVLHAATAVMHEPVVGLGGECESLASTRRRV
jgi:hypothetical protein